jgi:hypothetical protein
MLQTVQLAIADAVYASTVREALSRNCAWHVESVDRPDLSQACVLVLDEVGFARLPLPLSNPERVVLITRKDPQHMAQAWEAGIVSMVSMEDPVSTVLLAIMSAALRIGTAHSAAAPSGISPNESPVAAHIPPEHRPSGQKRCKIQ